MIVSGRHFLRFVAQNILLQLIDCHRKFDLSAFLAFRVGKCHRNKNNAPESVCTGKMFTKAEGRGEGEDDDGRKQNRYTGCHITNAYIKRGRISNPPEQKRQQFFFFNS